MLPSSLFETSKVILSLKNLFYPLNKKMQMAFFKIKNIHPHFYYLEAKSDSQVIQKTLNLVLKEVARNAIIKSA